jgi:hypothetical protein
MWSSVEGIDRLYVAVVEPLRRHPSRRFEPSGHSQVVEHVRRDAGDSWIVETEHPVGRSDRHHLTALGAGGTAREHDGIAVANTGEAVLAGVAIQSARDELGVALVAERGDRRGVFADAQIARWCERHDLDVVGHAGPMRCDRQLVLVEVDRAPDRLVADHAVIGSQDVSVHQPRPLQHPVVVPVDDETADTSGSGGTEPVVQAERGPGTEQLPLRLPDQRIGPHAGHLLGPPFGDHRVVLVRGVLVADHRRPVPTVFETDLPEHRVAREAGEVSASPHVLLHRAALVTRPVLVVADADDGSVRGQQVGELFEVGRHGVVEAVSLPFGPLHESACMGEPSGRADGRWVGVLGAIPLEDCAVDVRLLAPAHRSRLAVVAVDLLAHQESATEGASVGDAVPAGVEAAPAPGVVGVPGVGVEHVQRCGRFGGVAADHERRMCDVPAGRCPVRSEGHEVEAGTPGRVDGELDADRPTATVRVGIGRRGDVFAGQTGRLPHQLAVRTPSLDPHVEASASRRHVNRDRLAVSVAQAPAVALDVVVERLVVAGLPRLHDASLVDVRIAGRTLAEPPSAARSSDSMYDNCLDTPTGEAHTSSRGTTKRRHDMLVCTTWKARPLSPEASQRMMAIWGKIEADEAANTHSERLCWYMNSDGSGGFTVSRMDDADAAMAAGLESTLALGEFLEFETRVVLDLETAMPAITAAMERINV